MNDQVTLTINGESVTVKKGTTVYQAAMQLGAEIPIFCYQDRMPPFGACRVCLVEVDKMPKLQASCTLVATEGMNVKTESARAVDGRKGILELLLINHPLDCPICDKGGECPLQENALSHGPGKSAFFEDKRKFTKALPLGSVLMLDRERCIICSRCTRFGEEIAGDHALQMFDRGFKSEVGTKDHAPVDSKFIGNTISICPVGALTSQVYRFRARPWDNDSVNSSCTLCPVGCSMVFDSRDGEIMRTRFLENRAVNDIWLCDKGFFGYEFVSSPSRLLKPLIRRNNKLEETTYEEAFSFIAEQLKKSKNSAGFGGNPLTVEENYLFQKLMRDVLKTPHIDHRIGFELDVCPEMEISIDNLEQLETAFLFGVNLTEEFPVLWLRLRQAINKGAKVFYSGYFATEIAPYLTENKIHRPGEELDAVEALLKYIESDKRTAIFIGSEYLHSQKGEKLLDFLTKFRQNNLNLSLNILEGTENSMGALIAGMHPDFGPLGIKLNETGLKALDVLQEAAANSWDALYVAGSNPAAKFSKALFEKARKNIKCLIVQDIFLTETAEMADVVLPTLCYAEKGGSFINIEGRVQRLQPGKELPNGIYSDFEIFSILAEKLSSPISIDADFTAALQKGLIKPAISGMRKKEQQTEKFEGSLFAVFEKRLFDQGVRMRHNEHLAKLAKSPKVRMNEKESETRGLKNGDAILIATQDKSIQGYLEIDKSVADETVVLPLGFPELFVHNLSDSLFNGMAVSIKGAQNG